MGKIVIIDYGAGNTRSVLYALQRLGIHASVSDVPEEIRAAEKVIFPGVGQAASAMTRLREKSLDILLPTLTQPVLGVCLGLQLMCRRTNEGEIKGMGIFDADVHHFRSAGNTTATLRIPHMGWNSVEGRGSLLLKGIAGGSYFYFVHSYYAETAPQTTATAEYGIPFSAVMERDNFFATQFHPEKSGPAGEKVLHNFLTL
jgi:glutamine amidotransferase